MMLYLSPTLERAAWDIVIACVAHELAHLALRHEYKSVGLEDDERQEREAWEKVIEWGYGKQAKKHETMHKVLATKEERLVERLINAGGD